MAIRVLQILDHDLDFQSERTADDLMHLDGDEISVERRVVGAGGDDRGIGSAVWRLRRRGDFDLVHTLGRRALWAAAMGMRCPIVHSLPSEVSDTHIRWLRAIRAYRPVRIVGASDFEMRRLAQKGIEIDGCTLIHPGVDFSRLKRKRDAGMREALGLREDDYVLLAPGESTKLARHDLALWVCAILSELDERYKLLLWGRGTIAQALSYKNRRWRRPGMARFAQQKLKREVQHEDLLAMADAVLLTAEDGIATLPIAMSMAAGLPIVSVVNRTTSELLEDRHTAAMVRTTRARDLARRVLDVRSGAELQWSIADRARAEAYEHFSLAKAMDQWRALYEEIKVGASTTFVKPNL